jgi:polar amino acid transport system permease protein
MIEFTFEQILTNLLLAARWTIVLSIVSFVAGGIVGFVLLIMRVSSSRVLRTIVKVYIEIFPGHTAPDATVPRVLRFAAARH